MRCRCPAGRHTSTVYAQASKHAKIANNRPQQSSVAIDHERVYTDRGYVMDRQLGPIEMGRIPGTYCGGCMHGWLLLIHAGVALLMSHGPTHLMAQERDVAS